MPTLTMSHHLERDPAAVTAVRSWMVALLETQTNLSRPRIDEVALMLSELATNVIRHTESEADITLLIDGSSVRVEVGDDGPGEPVVRPLQPDRVGGNGLRIVEAWSTEWGVIRGPNGGKTVWLCVSL